MKAIKICKRMKRARCVSPLFCFIIVSRAVYECMSVYMKKTDTCFLC